MRHGRAALRLGYSHQEEAWYGATGRLGRANEAPYLTASASSVVDHGLCKFRSCLDMKRLQNKRMERDAENCRRFAMAVPSAPHP